ncbi:hypothetical protein ACS64L_006300, partial [Pseudomonas aeruginosa]
VLAHGVDAGSKLILEVGRGQDEIGEHEIAPMELNQPGSWWEAGWHMGDKGEGLRVACLLGLGQWQAQ